MVVFEDIGFECYTVDPFGDCTKCPHFEACWKGLKEVQKTFLVPDDQEITNGLVH